MISWNDFEKVELCAGTIIRVEYFEKARKPAYKLWIDFGDTIGIKQSSAQIRVLYSKEELLGKQVVAVVNFLPKQIADFISEVLVTGFYNADGAIVLTSLASHVPNGTRLC